MDYTGHQTAAGSLNATSVRRDTTLARHRGLPQTPEIDSTPANPPTHLPFPHNLTTAPLGKISLMSSEPRFHKGAGGSERQIGRAVCRVGVGGVGVVCVCVCPRSAAGKGTGQKSSKKFKSFLVCSRVVRGRTNKVCAYFIHYQKKFQQYLKE